MAILTGLARVTFRVNLLLYDADLINPAIKLLKMKIDE
jgi:hypothetical protein